jgi:hypothetical protein
MESAAWAQKPAAEEALRLLAIAGRLSKQGRRKDESRISLGSDLSQQVDEAGICAQGVQIRIDARLEQTGVAVIVGPL